MQSKVALEKPPAEANAAIAAYALYNAKDRRYLAAPGHWRYTGVLANARLFRFPELAAEVLSGLEARGELDEKHWEVYAIISTIDRVEEETPPKSAPVPVEAPKSVTKSVWSKR
jgi:hypothetical protein